MNFNGGYNYDPSIWINENSKKKKSPTSEAKGQIRYLKFP